MMGQWDELDQKYGRKVEYLTSHGTKATAYLDTHVGDWTYAGTEKHTDEPVTVRWDRQWEVYREVV